MGYKVVDSKLAHSILPNEYQEVKYIENTGNEWIKTGITQNYNKSIKIQATMQRNSTQTNYAYWFGNAYTQFNTYDYLIQNIKSNIEVFFENGEEIVKVNGITQLTRQWEYSNNYENINIFLFNLGYPAEEAHYSSTASPYLLFNCKIFENDILVRNFIPCYRKSDNKPGMYDTINDVFHVNQGTGEFIVGPRLFNTIKYQLMDGESNKAYKIGG